MIRALYTSATGLNAQQTVVDNTANNLANVNTNGFKKGQADFQDLVYVTERQAGSDSAQGVQLPSGLQIGHGVRVAGITKVHSQGSLVNTGNPLDAAIEGEGLFQVSMPSGDTRYTRDGAFRRNATGNLVTADGFAVSPQITIPADASSVSIGSDGTVSVTLPGSSTATSVGQLLLARFPNPSGLSAEGRNLLSSTSASGDPKITTAGSDGAGSIRGGFQERSNVDMVTELVSLILAQRVYEINTRAIRTADTMLGNTAEVVR